MFHKYGGRLDTSYCYQLAAYKGNRNIIKTWTKITPLVTPPSFLFCKKVFFLNIFPVFNLKGYDVNWAEDTDVVKCVHILTEKSLDKSMQCTQLSWNRTGSTIAASYGRLDHQDWCTHKV